MASEFTAGSFFARWVFAILLVFGTYNPYPGPYSYVSWVLGENTELGPIVAIVGLVLLIGWLIYLRSTFLALGVVGIVLGSALFAAIVWLFVDLGLYSVESTGIIYLALLLISLILATGMSWSHIRRRLTGQIDVDDVED